MSDTVTLVDYYYTMVPDKVGEGARILGALRDAGINLTAFEPPKEGFLDQWRRSPGRYGGDPRETGGCQGQRYRRGRGVRGGGAFWCDSVGEAEGCEEGGGGARGGVADRSAASQSTFAVEAVLAARRRGQSDGVLRVSLRTRYVQGRGVSVRYCR
jgi:hypothetical protein